MLRLSCTIPRKLYVSRPFAANRTRLVLAAETAMMTKTPTVTTSLGKYGVPHGCKQHSRCAHPGIETSTTLSHKFRYAELRR